jgi:hypothetical protein
LAPSLVVFEIARHLRFEESYVDESSVIPFCRAARALTTKKAGDDGGSDTNEAGESAAAAAPKWPYYARSVPHDEDFRA